LETVVVTLCADCLDGKGGECHTPGCVLWAKSAPDVSIRDQAIATRVDRIALDVNWADPRPGHLVKTWQRRYVTEWEPER